MSKKDVTKLTVTPETRDEVKKLKREREDKNIDQTINFLLAEHLGQGAAVAGSDFEEEHDAPQKKGRKINVQEPLYDLEALCKRPGMLEYYTGLDRSQFDVLLERLSEVRNGLLLFVVFSFWL